MADGKICVSRLEGSFTSLVSTCKTWDCSLKVLSGRLSSSIPDSPSPYFGRSKTINSTFGVNLPGKKCKKRQKRARRTFGWASASRGVQTDKEAGLALDLKWMIKKKFTLQLKPTVLPLIAVFPHLLRVMLLNCSRVHALLFQCT